MNTKNVFCLFTCTLFFCQILLGGELKSEEEKTFKMKSSDSITSLDDVLGEGLARLSVYTEEGNITLKKK